MLVEVIGHAGAAEALTGEAASVSKARAEVVAALLWLNGLPADLIKVVPHGAERPMVPVTGAEPQNKRAEIIAR
jgi:outer membrane protein OmpA-like peptidoglycan-associated protein